MTTVAIDFAKLRDHDTNLYRGLSGFYNVNDDGVHDLDLSQLKAETRALIFQFLRPTQDEPEAFRIDSNEAANRQRLADEEAALARLQQYVDEQGLLPVPENAVAVKAWLDKHRRGWSVAGVDGAIANLRGTLKWKPQTPPPVVAPVPPQPEVMLLPDGSPQLSLDTVPNRKHTKAQLQDLDRRQRLARGRDRHGWIGAAF